MFLVTGILAGFVSLQLRGQFLNTVRSVEGRNRVISTFGQHVSSAVADELLRQAADLNGKVRPVCVMVLDIRDFSDFASRTRSYGSWTSCSDR